MHTYTHVRHRKPPNKMWNLFQGLYCIIQYKFIEWPLPPKCQPISLHAPSRTKFDLINARCCGWRSLPPTGLWYYSIYNGCSQIVRGIKYKKVADRGATWSNDEVDTFVDVWGGGGGPTPVGRLHPKQPHFRPDRRKNGSGWVRPDSVPMPHQDKGAKREYRVIKDHNNRSCSSHKTSRYSKILAFKSVYNHFRSLTDIK